MTNCSIACSLLVLQLLVEAPGFLHQVFNKPRSEMQMAYILRTEDSGDYENEGQ